MAQLSKARRRTRGGSYIGVRVGEAKRPGPYSVGGASGSGGGGTSVAGAQKKKLRASDFDTAEGEDIFMQLERELGNADEERIAVGARASTSLAEGTDIPAAFTEPPTESQIQEEATSPWDAWVAASDGFGCGMEKGLTDGKVQIGPGFGSLVHLYQGAKDSAEDEGLVGVLPSDAKLEHTECTTIDQIDYKHWEACMREVGGRKGTTAPRKYAWDEEDFEQIGMEWEEMGRLKLGEAESHGVKEEDEGRPQRMDFHTVWGQLQAQAECEARRRYAR